MREMEVGLMSRMERSRWELFRNLQLCKISRSGELFDYDGGVEMHDG
jgi:hypothetical protein